MLSRRKLLGSAVAAGCLAAAPRAIAQSFPTGPVKIIVPYPPGGSTDIAARVVGQLLQEQTGQPFIIDNRAGAGGNIGAQSVIQAEKDGHTFLLTSANV